MPPWARTASGFTLGAGDGPRGAGAGAPGVAEVPTRTRVHGRDGGKSITTDPSRRPSRWQFRFQSERHARSWVPVLHQRLQPEDLRPCFKTGSGGMMAGHDRLVPCLRRPLASHRTPAAEGVAEALGRPPARPQRRGARQHPVRHADGLSVAAPAEGAGVRQRLDLLTSAARLAGGRGPGTAA
jgi:hypothetical protein